MSKLILQADKKKYKRWTDNDPERLNETKAARLARHLQGDIRRLAYLCISQNIFVDDLKLSRAGENRRELEQGILAYIEQMRKGLCLQGV